jgi:dipeptidase E
VSRSTILAGGGGSWLQDSSAPFEKLAFELSGASRPRFCYVPTASADGDYGIVRFYETFAHRARVSHLPLFRRQGDVRDLLLDQDVIYVAGGNTLNMLAIWRLHGVDRALREAWERGIVLTGVSAGSICWFESGVTDSYGPELKPIHDCLGFLAGSNCPHYDGEAQRRPVYTRLVAEGELPPGHACDDGAALHYRGTELAEVVAARKDARAYRVEPGIETPIEPARVVTGFSGG